jgi:iron complex transport system ATP-binding protein
MKLTTKSTLPLIEYRHVSVMRNGRMVLNDVSISIKLGEHVAIVGPNGSGKSSLVKTITRELYPFTETQESYLRIMGKDRWNVFELRSLLGVVSNELLEGRVRDFSGGEVMLSGFFSSSRIWRHQQVTPLMKQKVAEVLDLLEITYLKDRRISEMSTGEARRFLIGRALVHNPRALVLDEPTSSLDMRATIELHTILQKIAAEGTSIIMVTHQLPDIISEIKRVILIKDGRIVEDGMKENILTSASLSRLFGISVDVVKHDGHYQLL